MPHRNGRGPGGDGPGTGRMRGQCGGGGGAHTRGHGHGQGDGCCRDGGHRHEGCHDHEGGHHPAHEPLEEKEQRLVAELERVRRLLAATKRSEQPA
ncbi:MAG: DUF5320 family protein [Bryobacteraceae bacterium]|nr:DUF5320 family protein [Bryobacteraceae bacterium]